MKLASAMLVGYMLMDFYQIHPAAEPVAPTTFINESGKGELLVSLASAPLEGSVAKGASRVPLAVLNVSASCEADVKIDSIKFKHTGLGSTSDIDAVYLIDGFRRVSRAKAFDSRSGTAEVRIPALTIPKCGASRIDVMVDISPDADTAAEHGITIEQSSDIHATANTISLEYGDPTESVVTSPVEEGSVTVNFLPIDKRFRYGREETVARLQITSDNENAHLLKSITLTNKGNARDMNFIRFTLQKRDGTVLTPYAHRMDGRVVHLTFDPSFILEKGQTIVLLLKAQSNASISKQVDFVLEEESDLETKVYRPR